MIGQANLGGCERERERVADRTCVRTLRGRMIDEAMLPADFAMNMYSVTITSLADNIMRVEVWLTTLSPLRAG